MAESIHETNSQGLTQETSQQRLIRREKLAKLQEEGNDPFQITRYVVDNDSANIKEHFDALEGYTAQQDVNGETVTFGVKRV